MAVVTRGKKDEYVKSIKAALEAYEREHRGSEASLFRMSPGSIWARIVDAKFKGMNRADRHELVERFLSEHLKDDVLQELGVLLLLPPQELKTSIKNFEFENPTPYESEPVLKRKRA